MGLCLGEIRACLITFYESFLKLGPNGYLHGLAARAIGSDLQIGYFKNQDVLLVLQFFDLLARVGERLPPEAFGPPLKVGSLIRFRLGPGPSVWRLARRFCRFRFLLRPVGSFSFAAAGAPAGGAGGVVVVTGPFAYLTVSSFVMTLDPAFIFSRRSFSFLATSPKDWPYPRTAIATIHRASCVAIRSLIVCNLTAADCNRPGLCRVAGSLGSLKSLSQTRH